MMATMHAARRATTRSGRSHRHEEIEGEPLAPRTVGAELVREAYVERRGLLSSPTPIRCALRVRYRA